MYVQLHYLFLYGQPLGPSWIILETEPPGFRELLQQCVHGRRTRLLDLVIEQDIILHCLRAQGHISCNWLANMLGLERRRFGFVPFSGLDFY